MSRHQQQLGHHLHHVRNILHFTPARPTHLQRMLPSQVALTWRVVQHHSLQQTESRHQLGRQHTSLRLPFTCQSQDRKHVTTRTYPTHVPTSSCPPTSPVWVSMPQSMPTRGSRLCAKKDQPSRPTPNTDKTHYCIQKCPVEPKSQTAQVLPRLGSPRTQTCAPDSSAPSSVPPSSIAATRAVTILSSRNTNAHTHNAYAQLGEHFANCHTVMILPSPSFRRTRGKRGPDT